MRLAGLPTVTRMSPELVTDWAMPGLSRPWKRRRFVLSRTVREVPLPFAVSVSAVIRTVGLAVVGFFVGWTVGRGGGFGVGVVTVAVVLAVLEALASMSLGRVNSRTIPQPIRLTRIAPTTTAQRGRAGCR